ncbi:MAG TPA: cytochrome b/b6 domain-containing protein [Candidatus Eisenbacteria bacterium]|jgi:cytochrome b subunit of formate dehydrogenase
MLLLWLSPLLGEAGVPLPGAAATPRDRPPADDACLTCHAALGIGRSESGRAGSVFVDAAELRASTHGGLACVSCHTGASSIPHAPRLGSVACGSCHAATRDSIAKSVHGQTGMATGCAGCHARAGGHAIRPAARMGMDACVACHPAESHDYQGSVHGVALAGGDHEASTCKDCHGPVHSVIPHHRADAPTNRRRLAQTCARCHADRELMTRRKITIPEAYALYARSVHGRSSNPKAATCNDCHESHRLRRATDPASSIYRGNIARTCGRCHASEARAYETGVHGAALARGVTAAPTCTGCHGEHLIRGPHDPASPVAFSGVTTTCARCHEAQGIRETFGLPAGRLSTYQDSYHGLAARGGSPAVANCASCHGDHDILPSSDPRSAVSARRLPETCGRCHPGAGARFAMGPVHVAVATPANPVLYAVRWIYLLLIFVTIGGMTLHNGLDFAAKVRRHWRARSGAAALRAGAASAEVSHAAEATAPSGVMRWVVRMTGFERLQHALLAASFFTLVFTGFALKFPESWLFAWLARLEHGYAWRSLIHRGAAIVMVATTVLHVVYLFTPRGRCTVRALLPGGKDLGDLIGNGLYLVGLRFYPPSFERFGYIEKAEYWALVWGTGVMTMTGFVLWFENLSLRWLDKWMLDLATLVHYYEAWLAFLAIVVWHLYATMFNPDVYPMNWAWITGRVSEEQLRHEHAAEWARLVAEEEAGEAAGESKADAQDPDEPGPAGAPAPPA